MTVAAVVLPRDLDRVLALPRRPVVDCERGPDRRWSPGAQALVEVVTAKFARPRLSCGCGRRRVLARAGSQVVVFRDGVAAPPPLPLEMTTEAFLADNEHDEAAVRAVSSLRPGETVDLPGLGHSFCITELNPAQAWTLREADRVGGIFGMVSVGGGKTLSAFLVPLALSHLRTWVVLIKPDQRLHYRAAYLRLREHFRVPSIVFDKTDLRGSYIVRDPPNVPVLHVIPYSVLSSTKSSELLAQVDPDGVIADESHLLAARTSARTMRFLRFMSRRNDSGRPVAFFNWSGSTVKKSMRDCSHLAAYALGLGSPYPIQNEEIEAWSAVIDPSPTPDYTSSTARALRKAFSSRPTPSESLLASGFVMGDDSIRQGHRDWIVRTPGVVSTRSSSISCSITIRERKAPKMPDAIREALKMVRAGERPDGDVIVEAVVQKRIVREVASGFYNYWKFRKEDPDELILEWFAKRKAWSKEVRGKILLGETHLDSLKLCENAAERAYRVPRYAGDLPVWPARSWPEWAEIKDRVPHEERVRWIDDYLARDAAEWAKENRGVVWCESRALGLKIAEVAGLPYHAGGPDAEAKILAEDGSRSVIASIDAHGTGRDGLQYKFSRQLIAEIPSSGDRWEQLLGRIAREGQREDTVVTDIYLHVEEIKEAFRRAVMYAEFIEATTPNRQALLAADVEFEV